MLRLTYDPIFGVTVLYASGLEPCPVDRVVVADEGGDCSLTDPPSAEVLTKSGLKDLCLEPTSPPRATRTAETE